MMDKNNLGFFFTPLGQLIIMVSAGIISGVMVNLIIRMYKILNEKLARRIGGVLVRHQNVAFIKFNGNTSGGVPVEVPTKKENENSFQSIFILTVIGILCSGLFFVFVPVVDISLPIFSRFLQGLLFGTFTVFTFLFLSVSICLPYNFATRIKIWLTVVGFTAGVPLLGLILVFAFPNTLIHAERNLLSMLGFGFSGIAIIPFLREED